MPWELDCLIEGGRAGSSGQILESLRGGEHSVGTTVSARAEPEALKRSSLKQPFIISQGINGSEVQEQLNWVVLAQRLS